MIKQPVHFHPTKWQFCGAEIQLSTTTENDKKVTCAKCLIHAKQTAPKFKVGDRVKCPKTARFAIGNSEIHGVITAVERIYEEVDRDGNFDRHGLAHFESDITSICLPFRFDGETLEVDHPESDYGTWIQKAHTYRARFKGYSYTVKSPKLTCLTMFSERSLKLISQSRKRVK